MFLYRYILSILLILSENRIAFHWVSSTIRRDAVQAGDGAVAWINATILSVAQLRRYDAPLTSMMLPVR